MLEERGSPRASATGLADEVQVLEFTQLVDVVGHGREGDIARTGHVTGSEFIGFADVDDVRGGGLGQLSRRDGVHTSMLADQSGCRAR